VRQQLMTQARASLHEETKLQGMAIIGRLRLLDTELSMLAYALRQAEHTGRALNDYLRDQEVAHFTSLHVIPINASTDAAAADVGPSIRLSELQRAHLDAGKRLLVEHPESAASEIYLVTAVQPQGEEVRLLCASLDLVYLFAGPAHQYIEDTALCVINSNTRILMKTETFSLKLAQDDMWKESRGGSGQFEWEDGRELHLVNYWSLFLKPDFLHPGWTLIRQVSRRQIYAPAAFFRALFVPVALLSFWIALLSSLMLIRRNLVPLEELQRATEHVARREFGHRVTITSHDEFEDLGVSFNNMSDQLGRQFNILSVITRIDRAILSSLNLLTVVTHIQEGLSDLFKCDFCAVTITDPGITDIPETHIRFADGTTLATAASAGLTAAEIKTLAELPEVAVFDNLGDLPASVRRDIPDGSGSFLIMAVHGSSGVNAVVVARVSGERRFSKDDLSQARQFEQQIGVAFANVKLLLDLDRLNWGVLQALARAIDAKSHWTAGHSERVTRMALIVGSKLGLSDDEMKILHRGALLHDIGKLAIDSSILDKPDALTNEEFSTIRSHTLTGRRIVQPIEAFTHIIPIIEQHHERMDGKGYPHGLAGDQICVGARILAVVDVFDAISADRPYRKGCPMEDVLNVLREESGSHFDPMVVNAFLDLIADGTLPGNSETHVTAEAMVGSRGQDGGE